MTTNYYFRRPDFDDLHIGHFVGPSGFTFEGHFRGGEPWLASWRQWREFLTCTPGEIWDEYADPIPLAEFVDLIENRTTASGRRRQHDWVSTHPQPFWDRRIGVEPRGDWLDEDGFSFYGGEFS